MSSAALLSFRELSITYQRSQVVSHFSAEIGSGSFVALLGPNGAGKSSLLKSVLRLVKPSSGAVCFEGEDIESLSQQHLAKNIAYVPQKLGADLPIKVIEFVTMARYAHLSWTRRYSANDQRVAGRSLETCQIENLRERTLDTLSGGERQLVQIAAALAQGPKLLLLDEPTTFLDPLYQGRVIEVLSRARKECGLTLMIATHDINLAALNVDRVLAICRGKLLYDLEAKAIVDNRYLEAIYARKFALGQHPTLGQALVLPDRV